MLLHYLVKLQMSVVSHSRHWSIAPCVQVRCPVGIWNCHPIFPWCMATASPSAVLHDNSRRSLLLQVAQFHIPTGSAPAHRARDTIALLRRETLDFISPDQWPPNSPDIYPFDYKIWAVMQQQVYEKTRKWRRRAVSAPVDCVAQHWTKRHRRSDRSVACTNHRLCTSKRRSFWAPDVR